MANKVLNDKERNEVAILLAQGLSRSQLAKKYNVSYNTIKRIEISAKGGKEKSDAYNKSKEIADESEKRLLDILESKTPYRIVKNILHILDNEELLKAEIKKRGVSGVTNLVKTLMDLALKNQDIKDRRDEEDNQSRVEDNNFRGAMLEAVKTLSSIDTKALEAKESYVQED